MLASVLLALVDRDGTCDISLRNHENKARPTTQKDTLTMKMTLAVIDGRNVLQIRFSASFVSRIHTGPAMRGSVQVVVLFTENEWSDVVYFGRVLIVTHRDRCNTHDHQVVDRLPSCPSCRQDY